MKISTFGFAVAVLTVGIGAAGGGYWLAQQQAKHELLPSSAPTDERKVLYWYDPMQPEQRFDKPGKSPFMDMELVPKYAGSEQDPSVLSVPAQAVQNLGMRTSTVIRGVLPSDIEVVGSLAYNQRGSEPPGPRWRIRRAGLRACPWRCTPSWNTPGRPADSRVVRRAVGVPRGTAYR